MLVISMLILLGAVGLSVRLWYRMRDLRVGFVTLMLVLMAGRQGLDLVQQVAEHSEGPIHFVWGHVYELPVLVLSVMSILAVHYLGGLIEDHNRVQEEAYQMSVGMRHAMSGFAWLDDHGRYTRVDEAYARAFGYTPAEMVGLDWYRTILKQDRGLAENALATMGARGASDVELCGIRRDGSKFDQSILLVKPESQSPASPGQWFCCMRDVTTRKQAQREVVQSEHRYHHLFSQAPVAIWEEDLSSVGEWLGQLRSQGVVDLREYLAEHPEVLPYAVSLIRIIDINKAAIELIEAGSKEQVLSSLDSILVSEGYSSFIEELMAIWDRRDQVRHHVTGKTLSGHEKHKIIHWAVPRDGDELDLSRIVVAVSDITEHQRNRVELERYAKELEQANAALQLASAATEAATKTKSEFLANMSHEIRTPLTAILGYTELLAESDSIDNNDRASLVTIQRNGEHLLNVINDILDLSKIESGNMAVEKIDIRPHTVLSEVHSMMCGRAAKKGLHFEIQYVEPLVDSIKTDPTRLRQILMNLIGNAIKFTDQGSVRVVAKMASGLANRELMLCVDVQDTGVGIASEQLNKMFMPFSQADSSTTRKYGGTGLGLTISKRLAKLLGGEVWVHSVYGGGSTFTVVVETGVQSEQWYGHLANAYGAKSRSPLRYGQVDTQATVSGHVIVTGQVTGHDHSIADYMKGVGVVVEFARTPDELFDMVTRRSTRHEPLDLVLMDMRDPEMNGLAVARKLRTQGCRVPMVALSEDAVEGDREKALWAGITEHLSVPLRREKIVALVNKYLTRQVQVGSDS